ncbi:response regulator transcription factor [Nocardia sp. CA-107356]|uniref:helix-turn-helix transcriptional regulator n=1 Tax=Nocardia sp. CA-107356 TaxID=3239972 RepID=UPI003D8F45ED
MGTNQLNGVLRLVEDCASAADLESFGKSAAEGLARHLGYRHTTFMAGATPELCLQDPGSARGIVKRMTEPYLETYYQYNVFAEPGAMGLLQRDGVVSLDHLPPTRPDHLSRFLHDYLFRFGIHAVMILNICQSPTATAVMGVMEPESGAFGPDDLRVAKLVGRHLGNLVRWHADESIQTALPAGLTPRQAEVVALVARGLTNAEIARELFVGVDTVKKHLTQALGATGCRNRTQLGLYWLSNTGKRNPLDCT